MKRKFLKIKIPSNPYDHYTMGYEFIAKEMEEIVKAVESGSGQVVFQIHDSEEPTASNIDKILKRQATKFNEGRKGKELYVLNHRFFVIATIHYLHKYYETDHTDNLQKALDYCNIAIQLEPKNKLLQMLRSEIEAAQDPDSDTHHHIDGCDYFNLRQKFYNHYKDEKTPNAITLALLINSLRMPVYPSNVIPIKILVKVLADINKSPNKKNTEEETEGEEENTKKTETNRLLEPRIPILYDYINRAIEQLAKQFVAAHLSGRTSATLVLRKAHGMLKKLCEIDNNKFLRLYDTMALTICEEAFKSGGDEKCESLTNYIIDIVLGLFKHPHTAKEHEPYREQLTNSIKYLAEHSELFKEQLENNYKSIELLGELGTTLKTNIDHYDREDKENNKMAKQRSYLVFKKQVKVYEPSEARKTLDRAIRELIETAKANPYLRGGIGSRIFKVPDL